MNNKQAYYSEMKKVLSLINSSNYVDEAVNLVQKYIDLDAVLHKLDDGDDVDNPNRTLNQIHDKIEEQIKSYGEDVATIRNSIDSGSNEFTEDQYRKYDEIWSVLVMRSNAIHTLIINRNNTDSKYWE